MTSTPEQSPAAPGSRTGSPIGGGRVRRIAAILAIGTLPLIAAACATPADSTDVGAGAGAPSSSATIPSAAVPSTDGTAGSTEGSTDGSAPSAGPSTSPSAPDESPSSTDTEEPTVGSGVPDPLKGSAYTSTKITGREAVKGSPLTISFDAAGARSGLGAGCNSMGGAPVFDGDTVAFPQIVSTMMACEGGGGAIMKQESWYSKWLKAGVDYTVTGTTLTLEGAGVSVVFERSGDADAPAGTNAGTSGASATDQPTSTGEMTTEAAPAPVQSAQTPISGATIEPGTRGTAIPIPPTTK